MYGSVFLPTGALLVALITTIYFYLTRNFDYWRKKGVPSVPNPYPLVGNLLETFLYRKTMGECFKDLYFWNKDAAFVGFYIIDKPALLLRDPDVIKQVFVKHFSKFNDRNATINPENDPIGASILSFTRNPEWKYSRAKVAPLFSSAKLKAMFPQIVEIGDSLVNYIAEELVDEEIADAREVCIKFTVELITSCTYGMKAGCLEPRKTSVFREIARLLSTPNFCLIVKQSLIFLRPGIAEFFRFKFLDQSTYDLIGKEFWKVFEERKNSGLFNNDMVDVFIKFENENFDKNGIEFDRNWLLGITIVFFIAGFDTSAGILSLALHELCLNPEVQNKLRKEIKSKHSDGKDITYEDVESFTYLNMVIAETMRKYPIIHFLERKCMEDYQIEGTDVLIEKGIAVFLPLCGIHYDPKYFPNPETFDPERFSEENKHNMVPYTHIPFGEGPRSCIGKKMGLLFIGYGLARVLSEFEVMPSKKTTKQIKFNPKHILLTPKGETPVQFKKISI